MCVSLLRATFAQRKQRPALVLCFSQGVLAGEELAARRQDTAGSSTPLVSGAEEATTTLGSGTRRLPEKPQAELGNGASVCSGSLGKEQ